MLMSASRPVRNSLLQRQVYVVRVWRSGATAGLVHALRIAAEEEKDRSLPSFYKRRDSFSAGFTEFRFFA